MNKLILILIYIFLLASCQESENKKYKNGFILIGSIDETLNGNWVYLKTQENKKIRVKDSTIIRNGKFEFEGDIDRPMVYGIYIEEIKGLIGIFMENDTIYIEAYKDSLEKSKITGSKTNDNYINFIKNSNKIVSKMNHLFPVFQKARSENNVIKLEEINAQMKAINEENTRYALQYAKQHPESYIGALALHSILNVTSIHNDTIAKVYNNFSDYVKKGDLSVEIANYLDN